MRVASPVRVALSFALHPSGSRPCLRLSALRDGREWQLPLGWSHRLGGTLAWAWADRSPWPPLRRNALPRREWIGDVTTRAAEMRSPECPRAERRSHAGRASGEANLLSNTAWLCRRADGWRKETRVSILARVRCRNRQTGSRKFPGRWPRLTCVPEESRRRCSGWARQSRRDGTCLASCRAATRFARTIGCWNRSPRRTWNG